MKQVILEAISKTTVDKELSVSSHHGFIVRKSGLTRLIALYAEMTGWVESDKAVDVVCDDLDKAFDTVFCNILNKLLKYELGRWAVRWSENWLKCWAQAAGQWYTPEVIIGTSTV